jgi:rhodanese-related sulfurtransferase
VFNHAVIAKPLHTFARHVLGRSDMSYVTDSPAASAEIAIAHFQRLMSLQTDCADVADAFSRGAPDFVLLHVVGSTKTFQRRHLPGAIHLPHREISAERLSQWPQDTLFVAYCAGPHCNGADQAALKLAQLNRPVKIMIGGITGWADEGFAFASGS